jgi:hypothetical protein
MISRLAESAATAERGFRHIEADKRELAIVAKVDGLVVVHGRRDMVMFAMSARGARRLLWFLLKWWAGACWFGLREHLLDWAIGRYAKEAAARGRR